MLAQREGRKTAGMAQCTQHAMGTVMSHRVYGRRARACLAAVCGCIDEQERRFSRFLPDSEIAAINRMAGEGSVKVSRATYAAVAGALDFARRCQGSFNPCVAPVMDLWRQAASRCCAPAAGEISRALAQVDWRDVVLDPQAGTVFLRRKGQAIDLGGVGKGLVGDALAAVYRECGIASACANLGGNVVAWGCKPDGSPWRIGVQHPRRPEQLTGLLAVSCESVVTSGDYQRYFMDADGNRCHHILDPASGFPARSGLAGVTVVSSSSTAADALSTALFVAGLQRGLDLLNGFPGVEALFITTDLAVYITPGLQERFQAGLGIVPVILK